MATTLSDEEIYAMLKELPDFDCYPIPKVWFEKFGIPPRKLETVRDFINSGYTMEKAVEKKDLPPIIINKPQQDGKLVTFIVEEPPKVEVVSRPFVLDESQQFPNVLPSLSDK